MLNIIVLVLSIFGIFQSGLARIVQNGQCNPDIELDANFNYTDFLGTWYEIATSEQVSGDCSEYDFSGTAAPYSVSRSAVNNNFAEFQNGTLIVTESPRLAINWTDQPTTVNLWVLLHVNSSYALIYDCQNVSPSERSISALLLQRTTETLPIMAIQVINNILINNLGITIEDLRDVEHDGTACTVLPVITPGNPIELPGQCDLNINVVQNFNVSAFTGLWHEIESYYSENSVNQCSRARYTLNGNVVDVLNSQVINQELDTISGTATVVSTDGSARLEVILIVNGTPTPGQELLVLATDYNNYAISYTCINLPNNTKRVFSWILSRTRELSEAARAAVNAVIDSELVLNSQYYQQTNQSDQSCFYYPQAVPNQPVVTGGFCNQLIPVVTDFDAVAYMGTWHDIESYPSVFQTGTCRNANYELSDVVNVLNTQVINQALDTTVGFAVPSSNDDSGKLDVTFPIAGTNATITSNYWVLATDYVSYALVYSCVNLVASQDRQVWAWKISRTKQLPSDADTAINAVMATIPELDQRYFQPVNQSLDGCFYFPEPQPGVVVRFPGQCADDIPVVQNFNMTLFEGTWYEIQAYPKLQQQGQCISHAYSGGIANTWNVESSHVDDQFLGTSSSTIAYNTTDNSAKMTITISDLDIEIPFWILDVDYNDYALAYSCVNLDDDFRAVYSWKLSRTKQLSQNANNNIDSQIASIDVLGQQYYEDIDQSDQACFYLPELAPGEPVVLVGQCDPNIAVVENFDAARYLGSWRLIESYPSDFQNGSCNRATYTLNNVGTVDVFNTQVNNETLVTINGIATVLESGKLEVTFPNAPPLEYWVLATDYDSYSLVYSCQNIDENQRRVWSWKLSRTASLTPQAIEAINAKINTIDVLNNRFYEQIDHSEEDCFYFPDPDRSTTVRFRGSCNPNIAAVSNFNVTAYLGLWHNVELYPSTFQAGTCSNALYELGDDGVIVYNTQVVDQTLDTMTGLAVVASDDGTAKLDVTFPVAGTNFTVTTNYWVLATDYTSYSLVYTCMPDIADEEYVQVFSWKLSRTKQLTAAAQAQINAIISDVKVLDDRYYFDGEQTPEGCFYYPEPEPGKPVVFPGVCDLNIDVVQNFNLSLFEGIWHEIEAYPKEQQQGQCINHEYTSGTGNTLNLQSSHVYDLSLNINNGVLSFTSTDNSARMSITITVNGEDITIPFWILDTDYSSYALAYSCVNLENDYRGVYSWKLSRSKSLTNEANVTIDAFISNSGVEVLDQRYYENIDQSDNACFYLPNLAPGEPAIFPGLCDETIPTVANFDAARYLGRWRTIATYASDFQGGTCGQATYSLAEDGETVIVYNTQVMDDQTLDEIYGTAEIVDSGKLLVNFSTAPELSNYWVLATDYDSYSLVYSCRNIMPNQRQVWSWKLSRERELSNDANNAINAVISNVNVLNDQYYEILEQTEEACFYYPEANGQPLRFRGRCAEDITVFPNFNPELYLGLWHNVELYPSTFQAGTCSNALYELGDDGVIVYNTQVVDQTLDTMTGLAVVASDDGTAKLDVTFPVAGTNFTVTTNYWVLATDYTSYSLVYTCMPDIADEEYVQVFSWKLSRTKQLTAAAQAQINAIISDVKVLDDRYYFDGEQTPEGCFYYPEPEPGKPVVFPGVCDLNIDVVQNFNLSLFEGIWHEIEAYPKEQQQGQCINHEYTSGTGNTLNLQSSHVYDLSLNINNGVLSFTSTDNSARMSITITVNGEDITIPFWILDTDYSSYALAYSCVNLENDYRGVYSWKLSRSKSLTNEANVTIDAFISNSGVEVLDQRYYENIDQSDNACFYLPNLAPGEPAIFPGLCDETIPTVANFDAARYLGRWRTIATYASDFQGGTCGQATYSLAEDGETVIVYNTQVMDDQTLDEIYGTAEIVDSGKLLVNFSTAPELSNYWVLATDYDSYSLVYSCRNIMPNQRQVWSWKLSRERELSNDANNAINAVISNVNVLNDQYYEILEQTEEACFYYPEANGQPLRFRGRCAEDITVFPNFNPELYTGTWYDIESYPQFFQFGTCPIAEYTLNGDVVDVYNTQVIERELDVINATAVLASDDGSAKLNVTFPIAGTDGFITTSYWILDTDYINYSLVYSCGIIDEEYYSVTSWKLSRSQELSPESSAAISQTMANVKELRQQYYLVQDHTDEACYTYPDNFGGPVILDGQCGSDDDVNVVENFEGARFAGAWYEIAHYPSNLQIGQCVTNRYDFGQNPTVSMSVVLEESLITYSGPVTIENATRGIFSVSLTSDNGDPISGKLYVLDTDYDDYALMYSCMPYGETQKQIFSWKLSRSRQGLSTNAENVINDIVRETDDLAPKYYEDTRQDDDACFYYPVFEGIPTAIILPGTCDTSITGVPNFNAEAYLGRWYEIQKYPQEDQFGECSQATYTSGTNAVDVVNTQVVNRTLLTQEGTAVLGSTDNTGQLTVTFVVNGETRTANYYILATDYTSYSLVHNCRNLDDERRQVFSWKLSRTPTLTTQADAAISVVIDNTQELLQRYYLDTSQSDEDCFYIPEFSPDQPVHFRGRCAQISSGITNFNSQTYLTQWWHEIESYPSGTNGGQCVSTRYEQSGNQISFTDTRVFDYDGRIISGTVTAQPNGQIVKTFSDGTSEQLWVLATDYDSYSLLLSCEDVDDEYMRVWSTKHSRNRTLSAAAQNAIAPIIADNDLLYEDFFLPVSQTDSACFYYPPPNGEQVILPGQCDNSIPTQANFDLVAYTGVWYQTERYPYPEIAEDSECIGTRYTLRDDVVDVMNWENVDGEVVSIEGTATWTEGTAILTVVLQTGEETTSTNDLYVLTTDYNTYALAYTCSNIDNFHRVVVALKLSRTRTMPAEATTAINAYMAGREELNQDYFIQVEQNEDCRDSSFMFKSSIVITFICLLINKIL